MQHPGPPSLEGAAPPPPAGPRVRPGHHRGAGDRSRDRLRPGGPRRHRRHAHHLDQHQAAAGQGHASTPPTWWSHPGSSTCCPTNPTTTAPGSRSATGSRPTSACTGSNSLPEPFFNLYGSDGNRPPVHYGGAFDDPWMRTHDGIADPGRAARRRSPSSRRRSRAGFASGWLGVDFEPEYTPWVTDTEITALATVAAKHQMPVFFHARYSSPTEPGKNNAAALAEVLQIAEATGRIGARRPHHQHRWHPHDGARASRPSSRPAPMESTSPPACTRTTSGPPTLASTRFGPGWQQRYEITYSDLQVPGTDQRLTESSFAALPAPRTSWSPPTPSPRPTSSPGCRRPGS